MSFSAAMSVTSRRPECGDGRSGSRRLCDQPPERRWAVSRRATGRPPDNSSGPDPAAFWREGTEGSAGPGGRSQFRRRLPELSRPMERPWPFPRPRERWLASLRPRCGYAGAGGVAGHVLRRGFLFAGRHPLQGGPRVDGRQPRNAHSVPRSPGSRAGRPYPAQLQAARRQGQACHPRTALPSCPARIDRATQDRFRGPGRRVDQGAAPRLGRGVAGQPPNGGGRLVRCRHRSSPLAGSSERPAFVAPGALGDPDVPGLVTKEKSPVAAVA